MTFRAPFPWFGGKSAVADVVWQRFGDVPNYVEPFAGSLAVLLARPHEPRVETVNDKDGFISNFWRAIAADPDAVAHYADWPVNENDLHARHAWLVGQRDTLTTRLEGDPDYYDARVAGWWVWGISAWIGSGWCSGRGPWHAIDGELVARSGPTGIERKRPHLMTAGRGINRQLPHLGNAGQGINRQLPSNDDRDACMQWSDHLRSMMRALSARLRRVRVCSGDWRRVLGPSPTVKLGTTAVFLDPPYSNEGRAGGLYTFDDGSVAADVRAWAIEHGDDPRLRIALCGYDTDHDSLMPTTWTALRWKSCGGYGSQGNGSGRANAAREVVWFSPHCLPVAQQQYTLPLEVAL